ncbi:MAG: hypothetical protein R8K22_08415 [Mariprofundaceae bacterium]
MSSLWGISMLTMLEVVRNKTLSAVVLVMIILMFIASAFASVTMGSTVNIVVDFGLASASILGNLVAIIVTIQLTQQERENRTLYLLLPRLPNRSIYILGKFIGLALVLGALTALMIAITAIFAAAFDWTKWLALGQAGIVTIIEIYIAIALALMFSNASSMFLAILLTIATDIAGRFSFIIKQFGETIGGLIESFTDMAYYLLPNLQTINLRNQVIDYPAINASELIQLLLYGFTEIGLILAVACLLFMKKDLQTS